MKPALPRVALVVLLAGCAGLVGRGNLEAMDLARDCQRAEAIEAVDRELEVGNRRQTSLALTIKAAVLLDEGRGDESEALYPEIRARRDPGLPDSEIDASVRQVLREIRDARERKTGSRQC